MSDSTEVDVDEVVSVAGTVRSAGESMEDAAAYAEEADPDMYMWGMVGLPLAYVYFEATPHIHDMLKRMPDAIAGVAKRIEDSAGAASDCDDEIARGFDKVHDELNSAGGS